jgi:signal transduction histidine kinase
LGFVVLQVSRSDLDAKRQRAMELAFILGAVALILGGFLAVRLGRMVVGPIMRVSRMIQRIGRGDFSAQVNVSAKDPLFDLQEALNHMAQRLGWSREEFERQIQQATEELREKKEEAEQATQAKSRFLAAASHDLRQPTHALGMFIARMGQLPMDGQMSNLVRNLEASVLSMQDLLDSLLDNGEFNVEKHIQTPAFIPQSTSVLKALEIMKASKVHMAFLVDEFGAFEGVVTATDLLEMIAGDFDEGHDDAEVNVRQREDGSWLVDGQTDIDELADTLGEDFGEADGFHTIAGLVLHQLSRVPHEGEILQLGRFEVEVIDMDDRRIDKLLFKQLVRREDEARAVAEQYED